MSINLYFCNPVRLKEPVIVKVMTTKTQQIRIEDFDYPLPDERIAKFPLPKRDESKLLLYKEGKVSESIFKHITDYLPEGSLMVFNNTRVIQARLLFQKETGRRSRFSVWSRSSRMIMLWFFNRLNVAAGLVWSAI